MYKKVIGIGALALLSLQAHAANPESVVTEVEFVAPITISENTALSFGLLDVNMGVSETVVIATNDAVTDSASNVLGGSQTAADLTVSATASQAINILASNVTNGTYYTLATFQCSYDGAAASGCDGGGLNIASSAASATLEIGATLTGAGSAVAGVDNGSFDVTVSYQ